MNGPQRFGLGSEGFYNARISWLEQHECERAVRNEVATMQLDGIVIRDVESVVGRLMRFARQPMLLEAEIRMIRENFERLPASKVPFRLTRSLSDAEIAALAEKHYGRSQRGPVRLSRANDESQPQSVEQLLIDASNRKSLGLPVV